MVRGNEAGLAREGARRSRRATRTLPRWDLSDLYPSIGAASIKRDLGALDRAAERFHRRNSGPVAGVSGRTLALRIVEYERLQDRIGRLSAFAQLQFAANISRPDVARFRQEMEERLSRITAKLVFFPLALNRLSGAALRAKLRAKALARYRPWLRDLRSFRPYQLDEPLEKILQEKAVVGSAAWIRLFDETLASLRVPVGQRRLTIEAALNRLTLPRAADRAQAAAALAAVFAANARMFAFVLNMLAKDKEIEDRWRTLPDPAFARHLANRVEPEVVRALVQSVKKAVPDLSHRYYRLKARWLGKKRLDWWDRNAPLPKEREAIPWGEARQIVMDAFAGFSPKMAILAERFFASPWIDAAPRPGKAGGAFSHPTVPSHHPYILLNYHGKSRDVMTLAHELGHGIHQLLAARQGALMAETPLTLAETASVFGEQLVFRALLERATPARRRAMLAAKVEDMLNTVVRQVAFYEFELTVHAERRKGELGPERLGEIWLEIQHQSLGDAVRLDRDYRNFWCYIPHFIHSPFYVYAYAFGDCLVNALYARYREQPDGFRAKYLAMLEAGGTKRHHELLAPFGLDARDPGFWAKGLGVVTAMIDELEAS
jgi:oligoendopeptidase F